MIFEITDLEKNESRVVNIDDKGYEWGKDLAGRYCRVAKHDAHALKGLENPRLASVRTSGNKYKKVS